MAARPTRLPTALLLAVALLICAAGPAGAHAEPRSSDPSPGEEVGAGRDEVEITFIDLDPDGPILIRVEDAAGTDLVMGEPDVRSDGATVAVTTEPLELGPHTIVWDVLSSDGDGRADGEIAFDVVENSSGSGFGVWLLWLVVVLIPAAVFLRPRRRGRDPGDDGAVV